MPILRAPFTTITPQATLEAVDKAKTNLPLDFLRNFTVNPLLMYPSSHAVLVPITACSMQRYSSGTILDARTTRLADYFAENDGANWRGDLSWNWAVGIVRTGKNKLPREYHSEEPFITVEAANDLVVDVLMGGHLVTATGAAASILSLAGKHASAKAFQHFPMYLFPKELSAVITDQFLTEIACLDDLGNDLARINNPNGTMMLVMNAVVERARRLADNPVSSNWDSAMCYSTLWDTLNRALECSPDDRLSAGSELRQLRDMMVDLICNLEMWLPLAKLLTTPVPCTAKPGSNELRTVLRQTSALEWVKILSGIVNLRYQPVTMWSAMDAVRAHIACGNPLVTNADTYSKFGWADDHMYSSLFDPTAGLRNESHGLLVEGKTMRDGFRKVRLDNNHKFSTFISLADMGRFRKWDHGFVSAIGCFALAHWIIFGTTTYNLVNKTRRIHVQMYRRNTDTDNCYEYLKAHTPPAFFACLYRLAETAARQSDVAHFPKNFWTELLAPTFAVPSAYTPPEVEIPVVIPSLIWGHDNIPKPLAIFPGFGAGLIHALYTTDDMDGFGSVFRLLDHNMVLKGIRELKVANMLPAGVPDTAGTHWKKVEDYIPPPRPREPSPVAQIDVPVPMIHAAVHASHAGAPPRSNNTEDELEVEDELDDMPLGTIIKKEQASLFTDDEEALEEEEDISSMMRALKGSPAYERIYADIEASFAALKPSSRIPKRPSSQPAGRVYKKKREDVD